MEIDVLIDREFKRKITQDWLKKVIKQVFLAENVKQDVEIGLVITGQEKITELNRIYLEEDTPTDVLSFPLMESDLNRTSFVTPPDDIQRLGEVIICYPQAQKQAKEHKHPVKKEVVVLIVHGVLHLLGYDHDTELHKQLMNKREAVIIKSIEEKSL